MGEPNTDLILELGPSPRLGVTVAVLYTLAAAALAASVPSLWLVFPVVVVLTVSGTLSLARHGFRVDPLAPRRLIWRDSGAWIVEYAATARPATLHGDTWVHPALVILVLQLDGDGNRAIPVARDAVSMDAFRRLRAGLGRRSARGAVTRPLR